MAFNEANVTHVITVIWAIMAHDVVCSATCHSALKHVDLRSAPGQHGSSCHAYRTAVMRVALMRPSGRAATATFQSSRRFPVVVFHPHPPVPVRAKPWQYEVHQLRKGRTTFQCMATT